MQMLSWIANHHQLLQCINFVTRCEETTAACCTKAESSWSFCSPFLLHVDAVSGRVTAQSLPARAPCVATLLGCVPHQHNVPLVCVLNVLRHARSRASAKRWYRKDVQWVKGPMVWPWFSLYFFLGSSSWLRVLGHVWILLSLIDTTTSSITMDSLLQADVPVVKNKRDEEKNIFFVVGKAAVDSASRFNSCCIKEIQQ